MDTRTFLAVMAMARARSGLGKPFHQALSDHLATWAEQHILAFQQRFDEVPAALYQWDMWAAGGGGVACGARPVSVTAGPRLRSR